MSTHYYCKLYYHIIWKTKQALPMILDDIENIVYSFIQNEIIRLGCKLLAIGGTNNHVHLLVILKPKLSISYVVKQLKGVSSRKTTINSIELYWQRGYSAFTLRDRDLNVVKNYIQNQKKHHHDNNLISEWEV